METSLTFGRLSGYLMGLVLVAVGIGNLLYVHPVPGIAFLLFSTLYFPPLTNRLALIVGVRAAWVLKTILWFVLVWFTLGISDLGEIMGF